MFSKVNIDNELYKPPVEDVLAKVEELSHGSLRERFHHEERVVLAVGLFYYFLGALLLSLAVIGGLGISVREDSKIWFMLIICLLALGAVMYLMIGYGLRRFDSWARFPAVMAAALAIFLVPVGTFPGLMCLVLLLRNSVRELFTDDYRTAVVAEGEVIRHYGWMAVVGGVLASGVLFLALMIWERARG